MPISNIYFADLLVLGSAFFFGIGFLGQRSVSVQGMGPMTCNAYRFGLSTILLMAVLPCLPHDVKHDDDVDTDSDDETTGNEDEESPGASSDTSNSNMHSHSHSSRTVSSKPKKEVVSYPAKNTAQYFWSQINNKHSVWYWGIFLGCINMGASGFQQWGITKTSASKVAFIAGFDLFLTPMFACCIRTHKAHAQVDTQTWIAVFLSVIGIFCLSGATLDDMEVGMGETLTLISTVFWTLHITYTDIATTFVDTMSMMCVQLAFVTLCSTLLAYFLEAGTQTYTLSHMYVFFPWLLFLAVSEGLGFVLMALGQNVAPPTHAAIILSLEGVFAAVSSYLILGEHLSTREFCGCACMLFATLIAEVKLPASIQTIFNQLPFHSSGNRRSTSAGTIMSGGIGGSIGGDDEKDGKMKHSPMYSSSHSQGHGHGHGHGHSTQRPNSGELELAESGGRFSTGASSSSSGANIYHRNT